MQVTFSCLPEMRCAYQTGIACIVLDFVILDNSILFYYHFHHLVGKTIRCTNGRIRFYQLQMPVFSNIYKAAWLAKNISCTGIRYIIYIWMPGSMSFLTWIKTPPKCRIQRIDTVLDNVL
jgi:hypothetical protein